MLLFFEPNFLKNINIRRRVQVTGYRDDRKPETGDGADGADGADPDLQSGSSFELQSRTLALGKGPAPGAYYALKLSLQTKSREAPDCKSGAAEFKPKDLGGSQGQRPLIREGGRVKRLQVSGLTLRCLKSLKRRKPAASRLNDFPA